MSQNVSKPEKRGGFHYGIVVMIGICLLTASLPAITINCASIFYNPVISEIGAGYGGLALYITIMFIVATIFLPFASRLANKFDIRIFALTSAIAGGGAYFLMSTFTSVWQFYLSAILLGYGNAFAQFVFAPILVNRWFAKRQGLCFGLAGSFSGLGALAMNPIGGFLIQNNGWRSSYVVFGVVILALGVIATLLVRSRPEDMGLKPLGYVEGASAKVEVKKEAVVSGVSSKVAFRTASFFLACLFVLFFSMVSAGNNQFLSPMAQANGYAPVAAAVIVSLSSFGNMIGKPILGAIGDKKTIVAICVGGCCAIISFILQLNAGTLGTWVLPISGVLFGVCLATGTPMAQLIVLKLFGKMHYAVIVGPIMSLNAIASGLGPAFFGFMRDFSGSFVLVYFVDICFIVFAVIMAATALRMGRKLKEKRENADAETTEAA